MYRVAFVPLFAVLLVGCTAKNPSTFHSDDHDHAHERDKMLLADAGPYHAALTAHLSAKDGNELDVFFETTDKPPKPAALPLAMFSATAKTADGKEHPLSFEPAEAGERKDDPAGQCSHFVAKAPWMNPDDTLTVTATVDIDGKPTQIEWSNFNPRKYAHHEE
jgi:hypothetical protein